MRIDLTKREPGCVGHPIIRLNRKLRNLSTGGRVEIIFDPSDIPEDAIAIIIRKRNMKIEEKMSKNGLCIIRCVKVG